MAHILVFGDSLTFHGPGAPEFPDHPGLWPNVMADSLGGSVEVDVVARLGWTARDGWWALTKDPHVWGAVAPRADALVLALGQMDQLPAAIPTYLRDGIPYIRPGGLRRRVRQAYRDYSPPVIRLTDGRLRQLPQAATDHYLTRIVQGMRHWHPEIPIILLGPAPWKSAAYPTLRPHADAVIAARTWAGRHDVGFIETDPLVQPSLDDGSANPDGLHWSWKTHRHIGRAVGAALVTQSSASFGSVRRAR